MSARTTKLIVIWNVVLTVLLIASLGANALWVQAANDPPVQVFSTTQEHPASSNWAATFNDKTVTSSVAWTELLELTINLPGSHKHQCAAIASMELINPGGGTTDNQYEFTPTLDNTSGAGHDASLRTIDFDDNGSIDDTNFLEVSTVRFLANINPGPHTFRLVGRKLSAADENLTVNDSGMVVLCFKILQGSPLFPEESEGETQPQKGAP